MIPERLNRLILAGCIAAWSLCLWVACHGPWWTAVPAAVAFAFVAFTPFALMHEAVHGVGASTPARNYALGSIAGLMFPTSFSMQRVAHLGHHARNRTDQEMYDYFLPHESRGWRNVWLYGGNLLGLYWVCVLLANLLYLAGTPLYRSRWFVEWLAPRLGFGPYVRDLAALPPGRVWLETLCAFAWQALMWHLLDLNWQGWLLAHWAFALHWSALQYADHAWSERDVTRGAWDLRVAAPIRWLALNYHLHRAHHAHPHAPWTQLTSLSTAEPQPGFWQVYLSMWRHGVQPAPPMGAPPNWSLLRAPAQDESA